MVDYSRFAQIVDSDEELESTPLAEATPAAEFGRQLLKEWLVESTPDLSADEVAHVTAWFFITNKKRSV